MRIRGSWIVAGVVGLLFVMTLLIAGWTMSEVGNDAEPQRIRQPIECPELGAERWHARPCQR